MRTLLLAICVACGPPTEEPHAPLDPSPLVEAIAGELDQSIRRAADGDEVEAMACWDRAHSLYDADLHAWVAQRSGSTVALQLDYGLGRVRDELRRRRGRPKERVEVWLSTLRDVVSSAPAAPSGV